MKFSDLLAQIGQAGAVAAQQASEYSRNRLLRHFKDADPETVTLKIDGRDVEVPTFALSRSGGLDLDELRVEFETSVEVDENGHEEQQHTHTPRCDIDVNLKRGLFRQATHAKVRATFKMGAAPEALSQIEDRLNQQLREALSNGGQRHDT